MGRPSDYTPELVAELCARLTSNSLRRVCLADDMPDKATVFRWLGDPAKVSFRDQYARACEERAEDRFEELEDIADDGTNDWMERLDKEGTPIGWMINGEHVQRSKLRLDTRRWMLSKMNPKKYGDKVQVDANHSGGLTLVPGELPDALGFLVGHGKTPAEGSEADPG